MLAALNILHMDMGWKLIDLDASANFQNHDLIGLKVSSGYIPPEMLWAASDGEIVVRQSDESGSGSLLHADPSQDMWALGCILYYLCTGHTLFLVNTEDNIASGADLLLLISWSTDIAVSKFVDVKDKLAKNLLSLLLNKDPKRRPSASRVLQHPFLTGINVTRLQGEVALFDVFLSYRVSTDSMLVERFYNDLISRGITVWWDKKCLLPGQNWEAGFCKGLVRSANFVALLSRGAINNEHIDRQNFEKLQSNSPCDNVLLEWQLALELQERGMLSGVLPVMIGDVDGNGSYSHYFASGCNPQAPDIVVKSVENKLREHLDREGLGSPYLEGVTVKSTLSTLLSNQGGFFEGEVECAIVSITQTIIDMIRTSNEQGIHTDESYHI